MKKMTGTDVSQNPSVFLSVPFRHWSKLIYHSTSISATGSEYGRK